MGDKATLAGSLTFINLADLFQILGGNNSTGILRITSQHSPDSGLIYFLKGDPVNAKIGSQSGLDAVYALFGWVEGTFEFHEREVQIGRVINNSMMEIVLDAMRMLDDGLIKKVGKPSLDKAAPAEAGKGGPGKKRVIEGPLVDYSYILNEENYRDGEKIVTEGGHGKWIWVVLKGSVTISRETSNGPMNIAYLGRGCFLGTFTALTFMEYARSATITALGDVQLGLLETELLHGEFSSLSADFKGFLLSLDNRLKKVTDKAVELFTNKGKNTGIPKDSKVVLEKGSSKKEAFTIVEGEAYVIGQTRKGPLPLVTLEKNDVFGYIPFMDMGHEPRSASVFASKDLKVNRLDTAHFQKEYDQASETIRNMIYVTSTCVLSTTKLASALYEGR
jgi:CRP-like cAMP-binding protein